MIPAGLVVTAGNLWTMTLDATAAAATLLTQLLLKALQTRSMQIWSWAIELGWWIQIAICSVYDATERFGLAFTTQSLANVVHNVDRQVRLAGQNLYHWSMATVAKATQVTRKSTIVAIEAASKMAGLAARAIVRWTDALNRLAHSRSRAVRMIGAQISHVASKLWDETTFESDGFVHPKGNLISAMCAFAARTLMGVRGLGGTVTAKVRSSSEGGRSFALKKQAPAPESAMPKFMLLVAFFFASISLMMALQKLRTMKTVRRANRRLAQRHLTAEDRCCRCRTDKVGRAEVVDHIA